MARHPIAACAPPQAASSSADVSDFETPMTIQQAAILALLAGMLVVFATNRWRFELVALCGLAIAGVLGLVPGERLFSGFSSSTVITVLEILIIVQALRRSHILESVGERLGGWGKTDRDLIIRLAGIGAFVSIFMNNIGALALMMPLAVSASERNELPLGKVLMPLSFATLLGGICSVVGTPANLIGSAEMAQARGTPLGFLEMAPIGLLLVACALLYFRFAIDARPLAPRANAARQGRHGRPYACELEVLAESRLIGTTASGDRIHIHNIVRDGKFVFGRRLRIAAGDILIAEIEEAALARLIEGNDVRVVAAGPAAATGERVEAVIMPESIYVGSTLADLEAFSAAGVAVEGVGVSPRRIEGRIHDMRLMIGDIIAFRGDPEIIAAEAAESGLLVLAPAASPQHPRRTHYLPLAFFAAGIAASALFGVAPALAFGLVVLALAVSGNLSLRTAFAELNWPILIMLGAMIPLGAAVADTGAAAVLAQGAAAVLPTANTLTVTAMMLAITIALTPFVNNPTAVLVLAPIGVEIARYYGVSPEPVIIAITIGASLDFLTPFGHHNNTVVMGIAGYSFADFLRLGGPLVLLTGAITLAAVMVLY